MLVAALPGADHESWGSAFHHLEGAALSWDGTGLGLLQLLRQEPGACGTRNPLATAYAAVRFTHLTMSR